MSPLVLRAYHSLPSFGRDLIASARGWQLKHWRYGSETDRLVEEALERERWSSSRWKIWRESRLLAILDRAAHKVPYYREIWSDRSDTGTWENLSNWPVLKKEPLRANPGSFLAEDCNPRKMWREQTSGSTGTPLTLWQSRKTLRYWYALFEARWRRWYDLSRKDRWAILGGQLIAPVDQSKPPYWVWNAGLNQLYLSSYHLSGRTVKDYVSALGNYGPAYIWGYASALSTLARFVLDQDLGFPGLKAAISNAEPLYTHQRELIHRAFGCRVYDTYGSSEMVCAASECEHGRMHLWPETGHWEVLSDCDGEHVRAGETGRVVCTGFINSDMPMIRYELGDRVALAGEQVSCPCGRTLPILKSVEGRTDDVVVTPDGRRIGRLDPVFKADFPIHEAQIVQETLQSIRVLVVPAPGFSARHEQLLISAIRDRVGEASVQVETVQSIPKSANGKFRAVISKVKAPGPEDRLKNRAVTSF